MMVLAGVCLTATGLGICLYFKKKVHRDTPYTVDDIEGMYVQSLYKNLTGTRIPGSRDSDVTKRRSDVISEPGFPGLIEEDIPMINQEVVPTEHAQAMMTSPVQYGVTSSAPRYVTPSLNSSDLVSYVSTGTKMTETAGTQVTSAKRTVVTVNLNMKEKENIKLNIFMNKDGLEASEIKEEEDGLPPRGLTTKRSTKRSGSSAANSSVDQKNKQTNRPKTPVKERLSVKSSTGKKKKGK